MNIHDIPEFFWTALGLALIILASNISWKKK